MRLLRQIQAALNPTGELWLSLRWAGPATGLYVDRGRTLHDDGRHASLRKRAIRLRRGSRACRNTSRGW
jgi:hypothetical protein